MKEKRKLVTDHESCEGSTLILEDRCLGGEPPMGVTGRRILVRNADMKGLFTPESVAEELMRKKLVTIPRDAFQAMLDELARREGLD